MVKEDPAKADHRSNGKRNDSGRIAFVFDGASADRGCDDGGQSAQGTNEQKERCFDRGQACEITKQVLRCAGEDEDQRKQEISFFGILQKTEL